MYYGLVYELNWEWFIKQELDFYFTLKGKSYYFNDYLYERKNDNWNLVELNDKLKKFILNLPEIKNLFQSEVSTKINILIETEYIDNYLQWTD